MRIFISDHLGVHKTTRQMEEWFVKQGHEVKWDAYYNPRWMDWCDVALYAWSEGMFAQCVKAGWGSEECNGKELFHEFHELDKETFTMKRKPIFVWAVDIDIWFRQSQGADFGQAEGLFYMSKDYFDVMDEEVKFKENFPNLPIRHLPCSLNLDEWTYKKRSHGKKIAVVGEQWMSKNPFMITQMLAMLPDDYEVHINGVWLEGGWRWTKHQIEHEIKAYGLEGRVFFSTTVESIGHTMDTWLEDKNYLVTFSAKDAFSIPVGEAMAKGIMALPHNFAGSRAIWGEHVWDLLPELVDRIQNDEYNSEKYLNYVKDHYSNDVVLTKLEKVFNASIGTK